MYIHTSNTLLALFMAAQICLPFKTDPQMYKSANSGAGSGNDNQKIKNMETVISKDGTSIAYEKTGKGPVLIVVSGALSDVKMLKQVNFVAPLAKSFTVVVYDRRGRGQSTDTKPYAVEREIEDLEALVEAVGGKVYLFGSSSGAALALLAAEKLGPEKLIKLALYEPPYLNDEKGLKGYADEKNKVNELVKADRSEEAVTFFLEKRGTPPDKLKELKASPNWKEMKNMGLTLVYDFEVLGDGEIPANQAKHIAIPTLIMDGEKSYDFIHSATDKLGKLIPGAARKTLKGQTHQASAEVLQPVLEEFFKM